MSDFDPNTKAGKDGFFVAKVKVARKMSPGEKMDGGVLLHQEILKLMRHAI